jgi:hypothetical protein
MLIQTIYQRCNPFSSSITHADHVEYSMTIVFANAILNPFPARLHAKESKRGKKDNQSSNAPH